ncbi:hypothetical protein Pmar_PMAR024013, partial [Perkinsus marinus ATCC 50983]
WTLSLKNSALHWGPHELLWMPGTVATTCRSGRQGRW